MINPRDIPPDNLPVVGPPLPAASPVMHGDHEREFVLPTLSDAAKQRIVDAIREDCGGHLELDVAELGRAAEELVWTVILMRQVRRRVGEQTPGGDSRNLQ